PPEILDLDRGIARQRGRVLDGEGQLVGRVSDLRAQVAGNRDRDERALSKPRDRAGDRLGGDVAPELSRSQTDLTRDRVDRDRRLDDLADGARIRRLALDLHAAGGEWPTQVDG